MKFFIGVGQKNYNHVGQLTNSSSCGFGEVQPVFSSIKESRIPPPIQISIIASVLRSNVSNHPILSVDQPQN